MGRSESGQAVFTPTYSSWANPIEAHFGPLHGFALNNSNHPNHVVRDCRAAGEVLCALTSERRRSTPKPRVNVGPEERHAEVEPYSAALSALLNAAKEDRENRSQPDEDSSAMAGLASSAATGSTAA